MRLLGELEEAYLKLLILNAAFDQFGPAWTVDVYQCVSIASYASAGIARGGMSVCPSVRPSVRHTPVLYQNEER